jgi:hypothetical protein
MIKRVILIVLAVMVIVNLVFFLNGLMTNRVAEHAELPTPVKAILPHTTVKPTPTTTPTTVNNSVETFLQSDPNVGGGILPSTDIDLHTVDVPEGPCIVYYSSAGGIMAIVNLDQRTHQPSECLVVYNADIGHGWNGD